MKRRKRLLEQVVKTRRNCDYEDVVRLLEAYGFAASSGRSGTRHVTMRKAGHQPVTVLRKRPLLKCYVDEALTAVELVESEENGES